jgi:hypothetical protein
MTAAERHVMNESFMTSDVMNESFTASESAATTG